jgi:hypothetical protein
LYFSSVNLINNSIYQQIVTMLLMIGYPIP